MFKKSYVCHQTKKKYFFDHVTSCILLEFFLQKYVLFISFSNKLYSLKHEKVLHVQIFLLHAWNTCGNWNVWSKTLCVIADFWLIWLRGYIYSKFMHGKEYMTKIIIDITRKFFYPKTYYTKSVKSAYAYKCMHCLKHFSVNNVTFLRAYNCNIFYVHLSKCDKWVDKIYLTYAHVFNKTWANNLLVDRHNHVPLKLYSYINFTLYFF